MSTFFDIEPASDGSHNLMQHDQNGSVAIARFHDLRTAEQVREQYMAEVAEQMAR